MIKKSNVEVSDAQARVIWEDGYPDTLDAPLTSDEENTIDMVTLNLPKGYLSPSAIETFWRCAKQYEFRYIHGLTSPPSVALVEGGSHHKVLEDNNLFKIKSSRDMKLLDLQRMFCDCFSDRKNQIEDWEGETEKNVLTRGREMLKCYRAGFALRLQPAQVERKVQIKIGPLKVLGITDVIGDLDNITDTKTVHDAIIDYKTVGRFKPSSEIENSISLSFYGWWSRMILKVKDPVVGYCQLKKSDSGDLVKWESTDLVRSRVKWFRFLALSVAKSITLGSFPPCSPESWACNNKFCGYFSRCRGKC